MVAKLFFVLFYIVFFVGLAVFKKTDKKLKIVRYLIFQIMLTMVFSAALMAILFLFGIGTTPMFSATVLGIVGIILLAIAIKKKEFQKYEFRRVDLVAVVLIVGVALFMGLNLFGPQLYPGYNNADPAVHFYMAQDALINGGHSGMFFYEVNNALIMNGLSLFTNSAFLNYKLYLIIEIFMLALGGLMFYALVSSWAKTKPRSFICATIAILYMLGYSLNNMIFGFGHLGAAVTLICFIAILCKVFWDKIISLKVFIPLMSMSALCIALCYMLFAPVVWIVVFIIIFGYCKREKIKFKKTMLVELGVFAIPTILAIKFCYFDFFLSENLDAASQIRANGAHYSEYIKNVILFLPPVIYAVYQNIRKKKSFVTTFLSISWLVFFAIAVAAKQFGLISPYYCSKIYHVAWLVTFIMFADGAVQLMDKIPKITVSYFAVIVAMVSSAFLFQRAPLMDLYKFNFRWVRTHETIGEQTMDGYRFATDEIVNKGEKITWATTLEHYDRAYWFYGIQTIEANKCSYCQSWQYDASELKDEMGKSGVKYIGIYKSYPDSYAPYYSLFSDKKPIFENEEVAIYEF